MSYQDFRRTQTKLALMAGQHTLDWNLLLYSSLWGTLYGVIAGVVIFFVLWWCQRRELRMDPSKGIGIGLISLGGGVVGCAIVSFGYATQLYLDNI